MTAANRLEIEMVQLVPPRPQREREPVRMGPSVIEKDSPLASVCDALGTYVGEKKYGRALVEFLFSPHSSVQNIYCAGVAGEGKSTFLNNLAQALEVEGQKRGVGVEIVRIDFAHAAQIVKDITGKYDTTQWTSREWERAGKVFTGMYNRARRKVEQNKQITEGTEKPPKEEKVFYLLESGMTEDALEWGQVFVNRGGSLLRKLVEKDNGKPEHERETLPIAFVSGSMAIPERAAEVRAAIPQLINQISYGEMASFLETTFGFIIGRRSSFEEAFAILSTGAPRAAIERMHQELDDMVFAQTVIGDPVFAYFLRNRMIPPPISDLSKDNTENQTHVREWAALYAMKLAEMEVLGRFHGLATVLYNIQQRIVEV